MGERELKDQAIDGIAIPSLSETKGTPQVPSAEERCFDVVLVGPSCPDCKIDLEEGFILDRDDSVSGSLALWVKGSPRKGIYGVSMASSRTYPMQAYRCRKCGLLRLYANGRAR